MRASKEISERFEEYKSWCIDHNGLPTLSSKDKKELSLCLWYLRLKKRKQPCNEEFMKRVEEFNSQFSPLSRKSLHEKRLISDLRKFIELNGRFPSNNPEELHFRNRILKRNLEKYKSLASFIEEMEILLGCKFRLRTVIDDEEMLKNLESWCNNNRRKPSSYTKDKEEEKLYKWSKSRIYKNPDSLITKKILNIIGDFLKKRNRGSFKDRYVDFIKYTLINNFLPPFSSSLYQWSRKSIRKGHSEVKNFVEVFNLHLQGNPKATFIIDKLKEKYITRD